MLKYKTRVKALVDSGRVQEGMRGTVLNTQTGSIPVDWDKVTNGHQCAADPVAEKRCRKNHGWFMPEHSLKILVHRKSEVTP